jgi:excisionase family DNA binding protein
MPPHSSPPRNQPSDDPSLLSSEQVAAKLNISSRCVLNWLYAGIISAEVHVGKVIRFREEDVMAALKKASAPVRGFPNKVDLVHLALWQAAPDLIFEPSWLLLREPTPEEASAAEVTAALFKAHLVEIEIPEMRRDFAKATMDAAYFAEKGVLEG